MGGSYSVSGVGYKPVGAIPGSGDQDAAILETLKAGLLCNDSQVVEAEGRWITQGDPTEAALLIAIQKVQKEGIVAVGFAITQSVADITDREEFKALYRSLRPDATEPRVKTASGQLYRLVRVIEEADWILTPAREARKVLFGRVIGGYVFIPDVLGLGFSHARKVKWEGEFSRDAMSTDLRNSMSALSTIQNIDKHAVELLQLMRQPQLARPMVVPSGREEDKPVSFYEETRAKADELLSATQSPADLESNSSRRETAGGGSGTGISRPLTQTDRLVIYR